jgi:alpha-glucosidase
MGAGVSGLWIDMNEPAVFAKAGFPLDTKANGEGTATTFDEVKNVYAWLMAKATREGQLAATPDRRPFVLTRAGFAGIQKYAAVWTGDAQSTWGFLAMQPAMLQGLGVSGVPFVGSDVGGFTGSPGAELYGRWFEVGAFSPFFRSHSATGTPNQEPYAFDAETLDLAQRMLAVRYALLPYWYESFVAASETGAPLVRPLWFEYPADAEARKHEDEWFVGPSILVAPVLAANVTSRDVYVPAGVFHDFYTGAAYTGPATVTLPAPLGRVPVLVRAGSVIAESDVESYVGEVPDLPRHFDVYPGPPGTSSTTMITEDDGATMGYARGAQSKARAQLDVDATGLTLVLGARSGGYVPPAARSIDVRVHGVVAQPTTVTVNGAAPASGAWREETRVLTIPIADLGAAQTIRVDYPAGTLAPVRNVGVAFDVAVPASTPAGTAYVASSAQAWAPNGQVLTVSGAKASGTLTVPEGTLVKYKFTRGDWTNVEVTGACAATDNRALVASWGANGTTPVTATVAAWKDHCP